MRKIINKYIVIIIIFIVVICIWILNLLITLNWGDSNRGTFGDMFGASNALYSGLALGGIIYTIFEQRKELKKQEEQIIKQNKELKETKENLKIQQFESTYFGLLSLHQDIVNGLEIVEANKNPLLKGRVVFRRLYEIQKQEDNSLTITVQNMDDLGHYFRIIYRIIKFVYKTDFDSDNTTNNMIRHKYIKFLRAQLSSFELIWICYWGMTEKDLKYKNLFENCTLFLHIPKSFKINKELNSKYSIDAFEVPEIYKSRIVTSNLDENNRS